MSISNNNPQYYSWHLSLRVDRPVEGCAMRPHAYMYSKKLDERDLDKPLPSHSKKMREPPPSHEFVYRWFRGPLIEACSWDACPRRRSFSPHDWSLFALGMRHGLNGTPKQPAACRLQCVSSQSSLYLCTFCNQTCFRQAWKTQYTLPKQHLSNSSNNPYAGVNNNNNANSRSNTPTPFSAGTPMRSASFDDTQSVGSNPGSDSGFGSATPLSYHHHQRMNSRGAGSPVPPGTPRQTSYGAPTSSGYYTSGTSYGGGATTTEGEEDWMEVSRDQIFIPGPDDVGRKLKLEAAAYSHDSGERLMYRVVKTDLVLARAPDPLTRQLVVNTGSSVGNAAAGGNKTTTTTSQTSAATLLPYGNPAQRFRVATYNVLAEIYATQQQYPYCDFWALSWDYRFQNILREIMDASPEVVCLQEVQADHYESHLYAALSDAGYEGVFKQKTRQSMGLAGKVDGCALFWKRSSFHLVESYSIEFNELAQRQATQLGLNTTGGHRGGNDEGVAFLNRLSKDNVAQLVVLELANSPASSKGGSNTQICIANTHLYSNKDFPDVKLWQGWQLLQELETFVMSRAGSPNSLPLIICGDFNSTPDTAVYELLSRQTVHPGHPDVNLNYTQQQANGEDIPNILPDAHNITHSFSLGSAYQTVLGEEPKQTNYTGHFKGVLDYIWYSIPSLRPLSAAPIPDESMLTRYGEALPSTEYSSDHIMLISDFQILSGNGGGLGGRP